MGEVSCRGEVSCLNLCEVSWIKCLGSGEVAGVKTLEKTQLRQQLRQQPIRQHATHKIIDPGECAGKTAAAKGAVEIEDAAAA